MTEDKIQTWRPFTREQMFRLLEIFDGDRPTTYRFARNIVPLILRAIQPPPTQGEMKARTKKARDLVIKFNEQFRKTDLFMEMLQSASETNHPASETNHHLLRNLGLIEVMLRHHSMDRYWKNSTRTSQYQQIAAAVGRVMAGAGVTVSSYYSDEYGSMGNAAKTIEVCIEMAELKPTRNLQLLALIAYKESQLTCN